MIKLDKICIEEMNEEIGAIEDALDYLKDFCNPMW